MLTVLYRWLYLRLTEKLYGDWAVLYDAVAYMVSLGQWRKWRESALGYVGGDRILELGYGPGHVLVKLSGQHTVVAGIDASPVMAILAARRLERCGREVTVLNGRSQELPLRDGSVDSIISTFPAGYILETATLDECHRVLSSGESGSSAGRLILVGLWVDSDIRLLRWMAPVFYGRPGMKTLSAIVVAMTGAGLAPALVDTQIGRFRIGGVIAVNQTRHN